MEWYGKIENGQIVEIREFEEPDALLLSKMMKGGADWRIGEDGDSSYDPVTQTIGTEPSYDIQAEKIVRTYEATDKSLADAKEAKLADIRGDARSTILAAYPSWYQDNVANGIYGSDVGSPMKTHIENIIVQSNTCENAVDAAETVAVVRGISPDWPVE